MGDFFLLPYDPFERSDFGSCFPLMSCIKFWGQKGNLQAHLFEQMVFSDDCYWIVVGASHLFFNSFHVGGGAGQKDAEGFYIEAISASMHFSSL